ncbi:MAG: CBS domain-containing protein [Phycisphaerales bacterium]|nr:CBS domain-containing protein [Phycisphaerales bacterium]
MPITVKDIMSTPVFTITMDDSIETIQRVFDNNKFHHVIVNGDEGECVGVISDRDLLKNLSPFIGKFSERSADTACLKRRAHQIMTRSLISVRPQTLLRAAARVMLDHRISCMPVVDAEKRCVGIITLRDVVRWSISEMEKDTGLGAELPKAA